MYHQEMGMGISRVGVEHGCSLLELVIQTLYVDGISLYLLQNHILIQE